MIDIKNPNRRERQILIVDDDASIARALDLITFEYGKRTVVDSGNKAIKLMKAQKFDLILTDYEMEGGNGLDVLTYARNNKLEAPIIMITAYATKDLVLKTIEHDIFGVIVKPFNKDLVKNLVESALSGQKNRRLPFP